MALPLFLNKWLIHTGLTRWLPAANRLGDDGAALRFFSDRLLAAPHALQATAAAFAELQDTDGIDLALPAPRCETTPTTTVRLGGEQRGAPAAGLPELRELVAGQLHARQRQTFSPVDEVLITAGASGGLRVALDAFVNRGDRVVLFDPTSPMFPLTLQHRGARLRWVPTQVDNGRVLFRLDQLARALRGAKLLILANPANPTGATFAPEDLEQIVWWARQQNVLLFSDEVLARFHGEGKLVSLSEIPGARPRTVLCSGVSKSHGLSGARVGWLAGTRSLLKPCAVTQALQTPFVPLVCQQQALAALRQPESMFEALSKSLAARRAYGYERLTALGLKPVWPKAAFFFWVSVRPLGLDGRAFAEQLLRAKKVLVTPGELFGPGGKDFVRVSFAEADGRLREGLMRLTDFAGRLHGGVAAAA